MGNLGLRSVGSTGNALRVSADGRPRYKMGGVTFDWSTITAVGSDTTLSDGTLVKAGDKYMRYGTVIAEILVAAEVQTVTLNATPDSGTFTITYNGRTTSALAFNASAATVQAALEALDNIAIGDVTVGKAGQVYTLTWAGYLGNVNAVTTTSALLQVATPTTITVATTTPGNASGGMYGPADTSVADGRQTATRGRIFILNETVVMSEPLSDSAGGPFDGGAVYVNRLNVGGVNQITLANLLTAMPNLVPVYE